MHPAQVSAASLGALLFLIVFGSLVAFTAYGWLLRNASTPLLSTYAYVNPAVAVFLGWAFVGEQVGGREIAAGLVILASVGMLMLAREAREETPATPESHPATSARRTRRRRPSARSRASPSSIASSPDAVRGRPGPDPVTEAARELALR